MWTNPKKQSRILDPAHSYAYHSLTTSPTCYLGDLYRGATTRCLGDRVSVVYTCYLGDLYPVAATQCLGDRVSVVYTLW